MSSPTKLHKINNDDIIYIMNISNETKKTFDEAEIIFKGVQQFQKELSMFLPEFFVMKSEEIVSPKLINNSYLSPYFSKAYQQIYTLTKLDHPCCFWSCAAITRSLYEIVVEVILLTHINNSQSLHDEWDICYHFRVSEKVLNNDCDGNIQTFKNKRPLHYKHYINNKNNILNISRRNGWMDEKNADKINIPNHWTGKELLDRTLLADKYYIDGYFGYPILETFYWLRYSTLSTLVHGSGFAGIKNIPKEHIPALITFMPEACYMMLIILDILVVNQKNNNKLLIRKIAEWKRRFSGALLETIKPRKQRKSEKQKKSK